ncbi:MAG: cytochrome C oxidase subunit IV family protein [Cytophagales bacterium]|nr:cytochrome C oxidase subunit IV family protein [Cytophagales bacterium]
MSHEVHSHNPHTSEIPKANTKLIWRTFWILAAITTVEFIIAFTMPANALRIVIFVGLTLVKAFYIVAEFMHLGHEAKVLIWSIVLPIIFIIWLLTALLMEGASVFNDIHYIFK